MNAQQVEIEAKPSASGPALGLGQLLCERSSPEGPWLWGVMLLALSLSAVVGLVTALTLPEPHWLSVSIAGGVAVPSFLLGLVLVRPRGGEVAFYEEGAAWQAWGRTKVVRYDQAERIKYEVVRERDKRSNGSVMLEMRIQTRRGTIRYRGEYLTRVRSEMFLGPKVSVRVDELDVVRDRVAEAIAAKLQGRLVRGQAIKWCGEAELNERGLVLTRGPRQGDVLRYAIIERIAEKDGLLSVFRDGAARPVLTMSTGGNNFWPCLVLLDRQVARHREAIERAGTAGNALASVL